MHCIVYDVCTKSVLALVPLDNRLTSQVWEFANDRAIFGGNKAKMKWTQDILKVCEKTGHPKQFIVGPYLTASSYVLSPAKIIFRANEQLTFSPPAIVSCDCVSVTSPLLAFAESYGESIYPIDSRSSYPEA